MKNKVKKEKKKKASSTIQEVEETLQIKLNFRTETNHLMAILTLSSNLYVNSTLNLLVKNSENRNGSWLL